MFVSWDKKKKICATFGAYETAHGISIMFPDVFGADKLWTYIRSFEGNISRGGTVIKENDG